MANWLLDYIEMTEYIPSELREQLTSIRELDLQVHNAMDELERDIKQFFSRINALSQQERQDQYDAFLKKCDVATRAASDKVRVADKLHDLVEKSMRLLDQGLEKLKEDLLEGDKAYVVEDLERRSQELDEQLKLEQEIMLRGPRKQTQEFKNHSKNHSKNPSNDTAKSKNNAANINVGSNSHMNNHRHSLPAQPHNPNHSNSNHHRSRNNSTGGVQTIAGRQKKRERKRLNSAMTIFNRNSRSEDDSSSQTFLSSPLTPDHLAGMQSSATTNNISSMNDSGLTIKGMLAGNRNLIDGLNRDKMNGNFDHSIGARQPILTAIDAAHAVSPNATNSDKLVLFSSNPNGDNHRTIHNMNSSSGSGNTNALAAGDINPPSAKQHHNKPYHQQHQQLSNQLLSTASGYISGDNSSNSNNMAITNKTNHLHNDPSGVYKTGSGQFTAPPLSSRHDPIMMAASQAINATQNMTPGRRTSSLKASYAAVNLGRLQNTQQSNQQIFDQQQHQHLHQEGVVHEVYCKCRSHIHGSTMIACDNSECRIEWFHYECVGITTAPEGKWYCDECKAALSVQKSHKQSKLEGVNVT